MCRVLLVVSTVFCFAFSVAPAQSPAERAMLARWDDSVSHLSSSAALDRFASPAPKGSTGANDLRIALVQLRRAALTQDRQLVELALIRLDAVSHSHRDWPWPGYLLARAFYALSDSGAEFKLSAGAEEGEQYIDAAMRHLAAAIKADPEMPEARRLALDVLVPEGDRELRAPEQAMLRALLARRDPEADALLVEGRRLRTALKYDNALAFFDRSLAAGGDKSRLQLERARTLQALGDSAGAGLAYWRGVEQLTPIGRESYRHDLAWILAPDTLTQFDKLPADSVSPWLRDFWVRRDAEAANAFGERLIEHLRRWNYAMEHFRVLHPERRNQFARVETMFEGLDPCVKGDASLYELLAHEQPAFRGDPRHREPLLDHRGLVYLHHGSPYRVVYSGLSPREPEGFALTNPSPTDLQLDQMVAKIPEHFLGCSPGPPNRFRQKPGERVPPLRDVPVVDSAGPNESWLYWFAGRWRVLNFRASCAFGLDRASTLTSYLPVTAVDVSWAARLDLTPEYHAAAMSLLHSGSQLMPSCWDGVPEMIAVSRADADVVTRTDSHTPFVPRPWNAVIQAFGLGAGADQNGEALVTFAIPFDSLHSTRATDGTRTYDVAARIVGYDHNTGQTFAVDTLRRIPAPRTAVGPQGHLSGWFEFSLDPGDWQIAVRMRQPGDSIGAYSVLPHVQIDAAAALMLSDIVTGAANGAAWPAPDGVTFPVAVLGAWPAGGTADVYYEVRGLRANDDYRTVITVSDADEKSKEVVRIEATDRATGPTTTVRKSLGLAQLKPGSYRIAVSVSYGAETAVRTRELLIGKP